MLSFTNHLLALRLINKRVNNWVSEKLNYSFNVTVNRLLINNGDGSFNVVNMMIYTIRKHMYVFIYVCIHSLSLSYRGVVVNLTPGYFISPKS